MYIKLNNDDYSEVMVFVSENNIKCESFDNLYDQFIKEEVEYFVNNIEDIDCDVLNPHYENLISTMSDSNKEILIDKTVENIVVDRDYLIEVVNREVEYGVKGTLKNLFIEVDKEE